VAGSLQIGLLDPVCMLFRSLAVAVLPLVGLVTTRLYLRPPVHQFAWVVGFLLYGVLLLNLLAPRFFCRALCPLGACLGLLARFALVRIHRQVSACTNCGLCLVNCQGAADPHARLRKAECFVCLECVERCPRGALRFGLLPDPAGEVAGPNLGRRRAVLAALAGALLVGWSRRSWRAEEARPQRLRPPGSVPETAFLERCVKCGQCIRVCPTNVLQPALTEGGLEGLWTPVMKMHAGYCELNCTLCGQVCPTGAIQRLSLPQKLGLGEFAPRGPVRSGTAFYDRGRCLAWAMETPCIVCQEVCPTSPKAIYTRREQTTGPGGEPRAVDRPYVDPARCIGCGICEHQCPVKAPGAIRVWPAGESRSPRDRLLLGAP
jgi:ferredoxin